MTAHDNAPPIQVAVRIRGHRLANPVQLEIQAGIHLGTVAYPGDGDRTVSVVHVVDDPVITERRMFVPRL
jgi:class 3 adenylate cyclase